MSCISKISLVMATYKRPELLDAGLSSIAKHKRSFEVEVIVVNDGIHDATEAVCEKYNKILPVKYFFSGQRNVNPDGIGYSRVPGFALNIGVKKCDSDYIILTCPEIYHIQDSFSLLMHIRTPLQQLIIPDIMYFDDIGSLTGQIKHSPAVPFSHLLSKPNNDAVRMPFFMGMWKQKFMDFGGYDEDFTGYACEDNDLIHRLLDSGSSYLRMNAPIVHLYHGPRCDGKVHPENPQWAHNWNLFQSRKGKFVRNQGRPWGAL